MDVKEDYGVIEQEYSHVDYNEDGGQNFIIEKEQEKEVEKEVKDEKKQEKKTSQTKKPTESKNRCTFIKKNGKRCKQMGKPNQSGGKIIDGYCDYHRPKYNP